jgi:hypothetical protein
MTRLRTRLSFGLLISFLLCLTIHAQTQATKFDEFGDIQVSDKIARLDNLAIHYSNYPDAKIFIMVYRTRMNLPGISSRRGNEMMNYLVETRGISKEKVVVIDGGLSENFAQELWIVPRGTTPTPRKDAYYKEFFSDDSPTKFDEVTLISYEGCEACYYEGDSIDSFADAVHKMEESIAYVIYYPQLARSHGRTAHIDSTRVAAKAIWQMKSSLLKRMSLPMNRIKVVNGGYRRWREVEYWIVPKGVHVPVATPNRFPKRSRSPV